MSIVNEQCFQEPQASELEATRKQAREKRVLTYDCFNAKTNGMYVSCSKGHKFLQTPQGTMTLLTVLRGGASSLCQGCPDYDDGGEVES